MAAPEELRVKVKTKVSVANVLIEVQNKKGAGIAQTVDRRTRDGKVAS